MAIISSFLQEQKTRHTFCSDTLELRCGMYMNKHQFISSYNSYEQVFYFFFLLSVEVNKTKEN